MQNIPFYIAPFFILTTFLTIWGFYKASNQKKNTLLVLLIWMTIQAVIGLSGFYTITDTIPPRFALMVLPPIATIILLFLLPKGRQYIDGFSIKYLTLLHTVRIPVEIVLFWLASHHLVSDLMTFESRNFDIISGITAPIIYYFGFIKNKLSRGLMLTWNFICLGLLTNVVIVAALSAPSFLQQLSFDQPNIAVLYFPFNWLPSVVVPIVLFSHLITIRQLIKTK